MGGRIVVGVDGSEGGRCALSWALDEARERQAEVVVVNAWQYSSGSYGVVTDVERAAGGDLAASIQAFATHDVEVRTRMVAGRPVQVLVDEARHADLLVVGSRGHGALAAALLGSVSAGCVRHAPCPVVVVPMEGLPHPPGFQGRLGAGTG